MPPHQKPSMDNRRKKSSSGDTFSFPSTPVHEQDSEDFEFGCFTPDSASSDPCKDSPADHLFFNGKLLPHAFPFQPNNNGMLLFLDHSRRTSRTSSISSKDSLSLMSSRSNSTNSRSSTSSCSSSARTSSSDNSERKLMYHHHYSRTTPFRSSDRYKTGGGAQLYGSSQRWQFITPVPTLSRDSSVKKKVEIAAAGKGKTNKAKKKRKVKVVRRRRLCWRFFRWLVSACIKCHAMEPSKKRDVVDHVKDGNHVKLQ